MNCSGNVLLVLICLSFVTTGGARRDRHMWDRCSDLQKDEDAIFPFYLYACLYS